MSSPKENNVTRLPNKALIKEQAAAWFVRIETGALRDEDIAELRAWVQQSAFHRDYLLEIARNWDDMAGLTELSKFFPLPEDESLKDSLHASRAGQRWRLGTQSFPLMAAVVATVCMAVTLLLVLQTSIFENYGPQTYKTALGEQRRIHLEDGSVVTLNTNSELAVDFSKTRRAVKLIRGEANFQVAKNPERPFGVYAGSGMVWAVGTAFNVRHSVSSVDVIVTEGSVKVFSNIGAGKGSELSIDNAQGAEPRVTGDRTSIRTGREEALLIAGEVVRYSKVIEFLDVVRQEDIKRKLAWQEGALIFKGESLAQAVAEISRYTDRRIIITDPFLAGLRVGGHYKTGDIEALFASLGQGLQIKVDYSGDRILLSPIN